MRLPLVVFVAATAALPTALGGPITYALCQTGCNFGAVACYAAAGFSFGTVLAATAPASILACNALQGVCMAACAASLVAPIP
ncbi:hypothetical protein ACEPAG_1353 [Sanghuangporus baumii]